MPATYAEWKRQLGSDLSYSAGIPVPTEEEEIDEKSRKDLARRSTEASTPERSIESVWAFFAYSISRAIAVMHGTCEVRGMITDVPGCYKACSRIASSLLELSGHLPETRKSLRRLAEMPHPPLHHPRDLAKVHFIHLDIISDSSLCIRPAQKSKNWKNIKGINQLKARVEELMPDAKTVWQINFYAESGATAKDIPRIAEKAKKCFAERQAANPAIKIHHFALVSWCCNEAASMGIVKSTGHHKGIDLTQAMIDSAILANSALSEYDAGMLLGPARAETWKIEAKWQTAADHLTARLKPDHFVWHEATDFWSNISKTDGWHVELTPENLTKMAQWLISAAEFLYVPYILRAALGDQCRDGDHVSDVASEKVNVDYLKMQMEKDWGPSPSTSSSAKGRSVSIR